MNDKNTFTGRTRRKTTRKGVLFADSLAKLVITAGGIGTIIVVLGVCVFLLWVAWPLFAPAEVTQPKTVPLASHTTQPLHIATDEYQSLGLAVYPDGLVRLFRLDNGHIRDETQLFKDQTITCSSFLRNGKQAVFGFENGSIQLIELGFSTSFIDKEEVDKAARFKLEELPHGSNIDYPQGVIQVTPSGSYRVSRLLVKPLQTTQVDTQPVRLVEHVVLNDAPLICVATGIRGQVNLQLIRSEFNEDFLTGEQSLVFADPVAIPLQPYQTSELAYLAMTGNGQQIFTSWRDGFVQRVNVTNLAEPFVSETGQLIPQGQTLTAMDFILGDSTLIWSDSSGMVRGGYLVKTRELAEEPLHNVWRDKQRNVETLSICKDLQLTGPVMTTFAASSRSRLIVTGYATGEVEIFNVTHAGSIAKLTVPDGQPIRLIYVSPKEDGLLVCTKDHLYFSQFDPRYPEASFGAFFTAVAYEGYPTSQHMWQSSAGEESAEPKLGMMPLVIGTLKATFFSMIFGAPLALLAAVYSSEFLQPKVKSWIKPIIEMMASLPSVVLGFLAGQVFAPYIENVVPGVLASFICIPLSFLFGAYLWQLMPRQSQLKIENIGISKQGQESKRPSFFRGLSRLIFYVGGIRLICLLGLIGFGLMIGLSTGPVFESFLFDGDIKRWLSFGEIHFDPAYASATGGWALLLLPVCVVLTVIIMARWVNPVLRSLSTRYERGRMAQLDLLKFLFGIVLTLLLCVGVGFILNLMGFDPRKPLLIGPMDISLFGGFDQRNALVVGFAMGFAIIPIIYTIADDALGAVPKHLRSASLGSGATPWQTAVRIIIPTAMSGLFSALMIGLGRAVGETMIVLMAAGNTPIMDMNIFSGFRTLSANIAVELPEAVRGSTHYRTLFLAGLVLFTMTFVINTLAEVVRQRFRKRGSQL